MRRESSDRRCHHDGIGREARILASRFSKGHHANAPQSQCSSCLFRSAWDEAGRGPNEPLDASG
jgi:hypothetical protein